VRHPEAARARRDQVLEKMARHGFLAEDEAARWRTTPLTVTRKPDPFGRRSPYYAEHVRREVLERYGAEALGTAGLRIETAVDPVADALAMDSIDHGARKQDHRQGWRGPETYLDEGSPRDTFRARARERYGDRPLESGRRYL